MKRFIARRLLSGVLAAAAFLPAVWWSVSVRTEGGELLPGGIRLPDDWPPAPTLSREPAPPPPYLTNPPKVIPIDLGRQLLVDDFLVQSTTLRTTHHRPEYHPACPVIAPDKPWEGEGPTARSGVFSDGVWYDPADKLFKMWYWAGNRAGGRPYSTCYAFSRDGIRWEKPELDVIPGTNIVVRDAPGLPRNSTTVWLDRYTEDPTGRYKMFRVITRRTEKEDGPVDIRRWMRVSFSPDGIHWRKVADSDPCADRSTVFYNPFRKVWVFSLRGGAPAVSRARAYYEHGNLLEGLRWKGKTRLWTAADRLDSAREDLDLARDPVNAPWDIVPSQLYNLDAVAYESVMLGLFSVWRGQPKKRPKINEVCVGYSRDGFHWSRPDRRAFCPVSEDRDAFNWGNVQSAGGCCLIVGDKLYFYVGGVRGRERGYSFDPSYVGLAVLRRDGFTSRDAGAEEGTLTTQPVTFRDPRLFVNVDASEGRLLIEVLDLAGKPIEPFTRERCRPISTDSTLQPVTWEGAGDLSSLADRPVRFRFSLTSGRLYAFWTSADESGASGGYVAAGGPGFTGPRDTLGRAAYR